MKIPSGEFGKQVFEYMLHGMYITGNRVQQKGLNILKRELSILTKLESISKPCECGKVIPTTKDEKDRELLVIANQEINLTIQELDMIITYISDVPWSFGSSSRIALKVIEFLKGDSNDLPRHQN